MNQHSHAEHAKARSHDHAAASAATVKDPVCGMSVTLGAGKPSREHEGRTYHFCSKKCHDKFAADPSHYLAGAQKQPAQAAPKGTKYTCPMHPEIVRDAPGDCPKCGMALEPMGVPAGDEGPNPELVDFKRRFWIGAALTIPLLVLTMGPLIGLGFAREAHRRAHGAVGRAGSRHAGHSVGRLAVLRARREVGCQSQPQHVHADRHGRGRGVPVQRRRRARAGAVSRRFPRRAGSRRRLLRSRRGDRGAGPARPGHGTRRARAHRLGDPRAARSRRQDGARDPCRRARGGGAARASRGRRPAARAPGRQGAGGRRGRRRPLVGRRIDDLGRAGAGGEGRRRCGHRRDDQRHRQPGHGGQACRRRHDARPDRRDGRQRAALACADPEIRRRGRRQVRSRGDQRSPSWPSSPGRSGARRRRSPMPWSRRWRC